MKSASMTKNSEPLCCCVPRKRTWKNLGELSALQIYLLYSNRSPFCLFSCSLLEYTFGTEAARYLLLHDSAVSTIASSVRRRDNSEIEKSRRDMKDARCTPSGQPFFGERYHYYRWRMRTPGTTVCVLKMAACIKNSVFSAKQKYTKRRCTKEASIAGTHNINASGRAGSTQNCGKEPMGRCAARAG